MIKLGLFIVSLLAAYNVEADSSSCQDIDHDACVLMAKRNSDMCSDPVLSKSACPALCSNCPVTCYNCNSTTTDVSHCNTVTCSNSDLCLLRTVHHGSTAMEFNMMCGPAMICSLSGKRNVARDITIRCCDHDLCNAPFAATTTSTTTSTTISTTTTTRPTPTTYPTTTTYIQVTQKPKTCVKDVIFMFEDSSAMVAWFPAIKGGLLEITNQLPIGYFRTRVAVGSFNIVGTTRWELNSYLDNASLQNAIYSITSNGFMSPTATNMAAVEHVITHFQTGNRHNVPDVIVLLTEAHNHFDKIFHAWTGHTVIAALSQLRQRSHNVITIAAGRADANEAWHIATDSTHFFRINDADDWNRKHIANAVVNMICQ